MKVVILARGLGARLPILAPDHLLERMPTYVGPASGTARTRSSASRAQSGHRRSFHHPDPGCEDRLTQSAE